MRQDLVLFDRRREDGPQQPVRLGGHGHGHTVAILAHAAFVPGWAGRGDEYTDRMRAARTYARRAPASAEFLAWLDAVEAECETISGHPREALRLIEHAESVLAAGNKHASPDWFTWFSPARLAAFKGMPPARTV